MLGALATSRAGVGEFLQQGSLATDAYLVEYQLCSEFGRKIIASDQHFVTTTKNTTCLTSVKSNAINIIAELFA